MVQKTLPSRKDEGSARGTTLFRKLNRPTNRGFNSPLRSANGLYPECPTAAPLCNFEHSTHEPRSRVVTEGGSHPVTSTLWQFASLYSTRSKSVIVFYGI